MFKEYGELSTKLYEITKPVGYSMGGDIEYYYEKLKNRQVLYWRLVSALEEC